MADDRCTQVPDDNGWDRGNRPVINVSWDDAQEYVAWLSGKSADEYRVPSESERDYATRAGITGRFNTGDCITTDQANFNGPFPAECCPTGIYLAVATKELCYGLARSADGQARSQSSRGVECSIRLE